MKRMHVRKFWIEWLEDKLNIAVYRDVAPEAKHKAT